MTSVSFFVDTPWILDHLLIVDTVFKKTISIFYGYGFRVATIDFPRGGEYDIFYAVP